MKWLAPCALLAALVGCVGDTPVLTNPSDAGNDVVVVPDAGGDAADAAPDAPAAYTPLKLGSGLVVWLDAQESTTFNLSGTVVAKWKDRTSFQNDATAVGSAGPTLVATGSGGKPTVRFNASALAITDAPSLRWGSTDDFTIGFVMLATNSGTEGGVWYKAPAPATTGIASVAYDTKFSFLIEGVLLDANGSYTSYHRIYIQRTNLGLKQRILVDGVEKGSRVISKAIDVSFAGTNVLIGDTDVTKVPYHGLKGDIAEVVAYHGALTDPQLNELDGYLKAKWGL